MKTLSLALLCLTALSLQATPTPAPRDAIETNPRFIVPETTHSPDQRYGVSVPVLNDALLARMHTKRREPARNRQTDFPGNWVVDLKTGERLARIDTDPVWHFDANQAEDDTFSARWSEDGTLLLWTVKGPLTERHILLKMEDGKVLWQMNIEEQVQRAWLARLRTAYPERFQNFFRWLRERASRDDRLTSQGRLLVIWTALDDEKKTLQLPVEITSGFTALDDPSEPLVKQRWPFLHGALWGTIAAEGKFATTRFRPF